MPQRCIKVNSRHFFRHLLCVLWKWRADICYKIVINSVTAGEKTRKDAKSLVSSIQICHNPTGFGSKMKIDCSETDLYSRQSVSKETCRSTNTGRVRISPRTIWPQQEQRRHFEKSLNRKLISGETLGRASKRGIHLEGQRGNRNKFTKKCILVLSEITKPC